MPLGLAMGINRWVRGVFDPPISFYWPIPPLAYLPLIIIWLGIGETAKIALITLAMLAPIVVSAQAGVRSVSEGRIQAALSLGATRRQVFRHVIARGALPEILTGLRIAVGAGWGTLVAAELVAATKGLGFMTLSAAQFLVTDVVFVGIFIDRRPRPHLPRRPPPAGAPADALEGQGLIRSNLPRNPQTRRYPMSTVILRHAPQAFPNLAVTPLNPTFAALIENIDLSREQSEHTIAMIREALVEHKLLVFRGQRITPPAAARLRRAVRPAACPSAAEPR